MEDQNIKRNWRSTHFRQDTSEAVDNILYSQRQTALQRLATRYRRFSNIALICILWSPLFAFGKFIELENTSLRIGLAIFAAIYFMTCSVMDRWLYHGIISIDCAMMPISEVLRLTLFYRKRHLQFILILLPMAFVFVGGMVWLAIGDIYFITGIIAGAIFGATVGVRQLMLFLSDYRKIID